MTGSVNLACPLCQSRSIRPAQQLSGGQLRRLWKDAGYEFTPEAWGNISPDYIVQKVRCESCGFVFFDPALAGNEAFYRQLEHAEYFADARPEFGRTLKFAQCHGLKRVLDVGCGSGLFLDLARQAGLETFGLELNAAAAENARAKGHTIFNGLLHELDKSRCSGGGFDLITLFQVLEHVSAPVRVMQAAASLLNPGGYISVAVPSEQGVCRLVDREPHQWPPHHVSRWRLKDLKELARASHLNLVASGSDPLLGSDIEHISSVRHRLATRPGKQSRPVPPLWLKTLVFVYRKMGVKFLLPCWGLSIYGYFKAS